jgi:hypothetical protein
LDDPVERQAELWKCDPPQRGFGPLRLQLAHEVKRKVQLACFGESQPLHPLRLDASQLRSNGDRESDRDEQLRQDHLSGSWYSPDLSHPSFSAKRSTSSQV